MKLKPCPFCGGDGRFGETPEGGHYIECAGCSASSVLMFPDKCDVRALLAERWNERFEMRRPGTRRMALELDQDDWDTIHSYIADYQARNKGDGGTIVPDGESNLAGAILAECVRDLLEYRALWAAEHGQE